jgi:hypothetical protein
MPALPQQLLLLATVLALAIGCKPKIGDDCQLSTDCSAQADRLCDITAPGGYCTVFNCEPGNCPEDESLCVQFGSQRSPIEQCRDEQSTSPYARAFCMATCEENSDCRAGYECARLTDAANRWDAILIDHDRGDRACMVSATADPVTSPDQETLEELERQGEYFGEVCHAEVPDAASPEPAAGGQGAGGQYSSSAGVGVASGGASGAGAGSDAGAGAGADLGGAGG